MLVEKPYFGGIINPKTYLNNELGSKFFFLSNLAYELVNLLVFEKFSCKMSKNWNFQIIIGRGLKFTYEYEVCFIGQPRLHRVCQKSFHKFKLEEVSMKWMDGPSVTDIDRGGVYEMDGQIKFHFVFMHIFIQQANFLSQKKTLF